MWTGNETLAQKALVITILVFMSGAAVKLGLSFFSDSGNFIESSKLYIDLNDQQLFNFSGLEGFGVKDIAGGVQQIYALRMNKTTIMFENQRLSLIHLGNESISFKYNKTHYQAILNNDKTSTLISEEENFDFSFPKTPFTGDQELEIENLFNGGIINLKDVNSKSKITNAIVYLSFNTIQGGNRTIILPSVGQGAYYFSIPDNKSFNRRRLLQDKPKMIKLRRISNHR
jgi:hypothetical protein